MNHVERFRAVMDFQPVDRLPCWEWAMWWDQTIARWKTEGLLAELNSVSEISQYFGLDPYQQFWFSTTDPTIEAVQHHVEGIISNMDDYLMIRPQLFPDHGQAIESMGAWAERQARGEFERLLPLMRSGGFIPSVDHQTPPHVTLDQYRLYRRLLDEYAAAVTP